MSSKLSTRATSENTEKWDFSKGSFSVASATIKDKQVPQPDRLGAAEYLARVGDAIAVARAMNPLTPDERQGLKVTARDIEKVLNDAKTELSGLQNLKRHTIFELKESENAGDVQKLVDAYFGRPLNGYKES